jgi:hypothetical protein
MRQMGESVRDLLVAGSGAKGFPAHDEAPVSVEMVFGGCLVCLFCLGVVVFRELKESLPGLGFGLKAEAPPLSNLSSSVEIIMAIQPGIWAWANLFFVIFSGISYQNK